MESGDSLASMRWLRTGSIAPKLLLGLMLVVMIPAAILIGTAVVAGLVIYAAIHGMGRLAGRAGRFLPRRDGRQNVRVIAPAVGVSEPG
jgi:hypothetical protein